MRRQLCALCDARFLPHAKVIFREAQILRLPFCLWKRNGLHCGENVI